MGTRKAGRRNRPLVPVAVVQPIVEPPQAAVEPGLTGRPRRRPRQDHVVSLSQRRLALPEDLPGDPLEAVPVHGTRRDPAGDGQAQTRADLVVAACQHGEVAIGGLLGAGKDAPVVLGTR